MTWSWIDLNFPWIGSVAAVVLLILLFSTNRLRSDFNQSRWRDLSWLSWLAVAIYLIHNVEEYGLDLLGQFHAFPHFMCAMLAQPPYPSCLIPAPFYLAVNLPLFWVGAPVAAILSRRDPILGLSVYGVIFVNALTHLGAFVRSGYNPGVLTALILFLPISFWVAKVSFGKHGLPYGGLTFIVADGILLHIVLIVSTMLLLHGVIGRATLTGIQVINAILFFVFAWLAEKWRGGALVRSAIAR
ncbi:HXXEE domain-containing protein [Granulicella sp. WH15]|uniref:HXXEE domain-containing protein n=1 Tax=Granulicella sp. WH15 TaxID=2602070 RepID=UPI001366E202|nr:HXXEE domain-containing protein [Granulicella sp. WH15]QHN04158.1 HXXEE domain-containing protein [Granulicella sp. WH15]